MRCRRDSAQQSKIIKCGSGGSRSQVGHLCSLHLHQVVVLTEKRIIFAKKKKETYNRSSRKMKNLSEEPLKIDFELDDA